MGLGCSFAGCGGDTSRLGLAASRRKRCLAIVAVAFLILLAGQGMSLFQKVHKFFLVLYDVLSEFKLNVSRDIGDVNIYLWTRKEKIKYKTLEIGDSVGLAISNFNRSHPTKILIHGFSDRGLTGWVKRFKKAYLEHGDYNIISIDWEKLAESPWYTTAAKNGKHVGRFTAELIHFLVSEGAHFDSFHVLGASLGAHVAGYVGYFTKGKLARITGLDPSGPLFHTVHESDRLDRSDAKFVDIIHTAGRWVGNDDLSGHVDFFPNLGLASQPGCEGKESLDLSCSHFKAWQMYVESIKAHKPAFFAVRCDSGEAFADGLCCHPKAVLNLAIMGEPVHNETRGTYFLYTNRETPLAKPKEDSINCHLTDLDHDKDKH